MKIKNSKIKLYRLSSQDELTSQKLETGVQQLEHRLLETPKDKPLKKAVRTLRKDLLTRLQKYERYQETIGQHNSFSKMDPDATFMRMKEDHMRNGQLIPGYKSANRDGKPVHCGVQYSPETNGYMLPKTTFREDKSYMGSSPENCYY
jgi:hypothetical protein